MVNSSEINVIFTFPFIIESGSRIEISNEEYYFEYKENTVVLILTFLFSPILGFVCSILFTYYVPFSDQESSQIMQVISLTLVFIYLIIVLLNIIVHILGFHWHQAILYDSTESPLLTLISGYFLPLEKYYRGTHWRISLNKIVVSPFKKLDVYIKQKPIGNVVSRNKEIIFSTSLLPSNINSSEIFNNFQVIVNDSTDKELYVVAPIKNGNVHGKSLSKLSSFDYLMCIAISGILIIDVWSDRPDPG